MRRVIVHQPLATERAVAVRWTVDPPSRLYRAERFSLRFPRQVSLSGVPDALLWSVALLCLHPHWALLRPCRVELPVELAAGEREFWLRLVDSAVATLELTRGEGDLARTVEIADAGPRLAWESQDGRRGGGTAIAFSGGKDSLFHLALLRELGEQPLAVTTTSPAPWSPDQATARRRAILEAVAELPGIDHMEVRSDYRAIWDNEFARDRYDIGVNELTDTFLYLSAAVLAGWARGADSVLMASEAEVQENAERAGRVVQHPHFMYSGATQQAVDALLRRHGIGVGSLTYPLRAWQVQALLWQRYPELRRLQYSCYRMRGDEPACNACTDCLGLALAALAAGASPKDAGVDLTRTLLRMRTWEPVRAAADDLPDKRVHAALHAQLARQLVDTKPAQVARELAGPRRLGLVSPRAVAALGAFLSLRRRMARGTDGTPLPGYWRSYLDLIESRLREPVAAIYGEAFESAATGEDADRLDRTTALAGWIAAPLAEKA